MSVVKRGTKQQKITHPYPIDVAGQKTTLTIEIKVSFTRIQLRFLFWEKYFSFVTSLTMTLNYVLLFKVCQSLNERIQSIYVYL